MTSHDTSHRLHTLHQMDRPYISTNNVTKNRSSIPFIKAKPMSEQRESHEASQRSHDKLTVYHQYIEC